MNYSVWRLGDSIDFLRDKFLCKSDISFKKFKNSLDKEILIDIIILIIYFYFIKLGVINGVEFNGENLVVDLDEISIEDLASLINQRICYYLSEWFQNRCSSADNLEAWKMIVDTRKEISELYGAFWKSIKGDLETKMKINGSIIVQKYNEYLAETWTSKYNNYEEDWWDNFS